MTNLKELTWDNHKAAERCEFVKVLMSGKINPKLYALYLWNQLEKYKELETIADKYGLLSDISAIRRQHKMYSDFMELWTYSEEPIVLPSVKSYKKHLRIQPEDNIFAHIYVHHMGDLSGGQIIAKRIPGGGRMYAFDGNIDELKEKVRAKCTVDMADEANICFGYAIKLMEELNSLDIPKYA